jgi:prepilin-type N-terminal cleavage/methylation domain-containing protein
MEQMKKINRKGFTLIELIITITIIGLITALVTVNFASTAKRGRDSRRMSDLKIIQMALEAAKQVGGTYPASLPQLVPNFMQKEPKDPKDPTYQYEYTQTSSGYRYTVRAALEDATLRNMSPAGGSCGSQTCNYEVTNP